MQTCQKQFKKRNAILTYLQQSKAHPSADMVYDHLKKEIPDLSLGTVYRNLSLFRQQGAVASLGTVGGVERFDGNTSPHVHFICTGCHAVVDMPALQVPAVLADEAQAQIGGRVNQCTLTFTGLCHTCCVEKLHPATEEIQG